jgi:hypothetical protein
MPFFRKLLGCLIVLGFRLFSPSNRFLTVAALLRLPLVCSYVQSHDLKGAVRGRPFPQIG